MKYILFILFSIIPLGIMAQNGISLGGSPFSSLNDADPSSEYLIGTGRVGRFIVGVDHITQNKTIIVSGGDIPGNEFDVRWRDWGYLLGGVLLNSKFFELDVGARVGLGGFVLTDYLDRYNYSGLFTVSLKNYSRATVNLIRAGDLTLQLFAIAHFSGYDWSRSRLDKKQLTPGTYSFTYENMFIGAAIKF